jgi:hypothetical protein
MGVDAGMGPFPNWKSFGVQRFFVKSFRSPLWGFVRGLKPLIFCASQRGA